MHALALLTTLATAVIGADPIPRFDEHFVSEDSAKQAPAFNLSACCYHHKQLPRVGTPGNGGLAYSARRTFDHFNTIIVRRDDHGFIPRIT
ncbi:hypothetical protein DL766_007480 [Monosporascus sp. MC13-8B]|uniref:Uncharacterized protein n=1 Tax=Monosporascus cannonballus TaxID=155416 RepID=A0ABY0HA62_9PEZI|nr:hypothetical protein DL762_005205 [Monosporascus cannonballus]RYO88721.1 hypothetical protein DL763_005890 [Monosporascus cannonballus]RYP23616.1 hypothetical protein DL766_007480 [Monosporascus sp. MC13-8B]